MDTKFYSKAGDFLSVVADLLERDEVRYGLIYGLSKRLVTEPHAYGSPDPWFCTIGDKTGIRAVAIRTPPFKVLLAQFSGNPGVIAVSLADSISALSTNIPGVTGDKDLADSFTAYWTNKHNVRVAGRMAQRIYKLVRVNDIIFAAGTFRLALAADAEILTKWARLFYEATEKAPVINQPLHDITGRINNQELYVWENGVPVSMAAKARPTRNGMRIGFVFTPVEQRCKGYATSCVAALARNVLDSGYQFCTLYTDLANPTSNSIYKKIGFEEVCDSAEYSFSKPG